VSLIHRSAIKPGTSTDQNNVNYWRLDSAVKKADIISKQSGKSLVTELSTMITPMVEELNRIVLSSTATVDEKLQAASLAQQILSKAVLAEASVRKRAAAKKHTALQEKLLEQRKIEQSERRARKQQKIARKLAETEQHLGGVNVI
jgi:hypothetical protein